MSPKSSILLDFIVILPSFQEFCYLCSMMTTADFIREHLRDDVRTLAFQKERYPDIDFPYALDQIEGYQTALHKLPSWAAVEGLVYPPHLNMEQCSGEPAAVYKSRLACRLMEEKAYEAANTMGTKQEKGTETATMVDLTGGFGVDFSFMSRRFRHAIYVERNEHLCAIARHNFLLLGMTNAEICCADAAEYLQNMCHVDLIFLDPARRDSHEGRTYALEDCSPNVVKMCAELLKKAHFIVLKLSPMLDWHCAVAQLEGVVEVHVVSTGGECKELLLVLGHSGRPLRLFCSNDNMVFSCPAIDSTTVPLCDDVPVAGRYLLVPDASVMKAGCFAAVALRFGLEQIDVNSHLYVSAVPVEKFPGKQFIIRSVSGMNKAELRRALRGITQANIAVRNFPLTAVELRRRLKLKDGGGLYIFATTIKGRHLLFLTSSLADKLS